MISKKEKKNSDEEECSSVALNICSICKSKPVCSYKAVTILMTRITSSELWRASGILKGSSKHLWDVGLFCRLLRLRCFRESTEYKSISISSTLTRVKSYWRTPKCGSQIELPAARGVRFFCDFLNGSQVLHEIFSGISQRFKAKDFIEASLLLLFGKKL